MSRHIFFNLFVMLLLSVSGCTKDSATDPSVNGMTCKLSGADWKTQTTTAAIINGMLSIKGTTANLSVLSIEIPGVTEDGTYMLNETSSGFAVYSVKTSGSQTIIYRSNDGNGVGGEVLITKIDKFASTISGTFHFYLTSVDGTGINFTEGVFNELKYVTIN